MRSDGDFGSVVCPCLPELLHRGSLFLQWEPFALPVQVRQRLGTLPLTDLHPVCVFSPVGAPTGTGRGGTIRAQHRATSGPLHPSGHLRPHAIARDLAPLSGGLHQQAATLQPHRVGGIPSPFHRGFTPHSPLLHQWRDGEFHASAQLLWVWRLRGLHVRAIPSVAPPPSPHWQQQQQGKNEENFCVTCHPSRTQRIFLLS